MTMSSLHFRPGLAPPGSRWTLILVVVVNMRLFLRAEACPGTMGPGGYPPLSSSASSPLLANAGVPCSVVHAVCSPLAAANGCWRLFAHVASDKAATLPGRRGPQSVAGALGQPGDASEVRERHVTTVTCVEEPFPSARPWPECVRKGQAWV